MKKFVSIALALIISLSLLSLCASAINAGSSEVNVWDGTSAAGFSTGSGTPSDPYVITTGAELDLLASTCRGGEHYANVYFKLGADIDWAGNYWTPIGYDTTNLFAGHFDGNGQTVYNFVCEEQYAGFFGVIKEGSVKNLKIDYATFTTGERYAGAIASWMKLSTIEGCSAGENVVVKTGSIMEKTAQMGGLFGIVHSSTVNACSFYGTVEALKCISGSCFVGGIAGYVGGDAVMKNCINYGTVKNPNPHAAEGERAYVGGVTGCIGASSAIGTIENCINFGTVESIEVAGGVIGRVHVAGSIMKNCYNVGTVTAPKGGVLVGELSKEYVFEGNLGAVSDNVTNAVGVLGAEIAAPTDAQLKIADAEAVKTEKGFTDGEGEAAVLIPIFNFVTPVEPADTTLPEETTKAPDEETTEAPDDETTKADEATKEDTAAPATPEATTKAPDDETTKVPEKSGCGAAVSFGVLLLCVLPVAIIFKKH